MMKTHYLTFVLRLRLGDRRINETTVDQIAGSVQQVGQQEIVYFDTAEKFQQALRRLIVQITSKELNNENSD